MSPAASETDAASPVRVVWVSPSYGYGGDLLYFGGIFRAFCKRFPRSAILVDPRVRFRGADDLPLVPALTGWTLRRMRRVAGAQYDASVHVPSPRLALTLRELRPDVAVVIEFTLASLLTVLLSKIGRGFAVLLLVESDPAARGGSANPLVRAIKRLACRWADAVQTSNEAGRRFLVEQLAVDPAKVRVAPYLTSAPPPSAEPVSRGDDARINFLFVNSLTARKGAQQLLSALALLSPDVARQTRLTIVGDGPDRAELETKAAALGEAEILFTGAVPYTQLGAHFAAADVLAAPSLADYRSLSGFEGLSFGLALLASEADGASAETLAGGQSGIAIDPGDPGAIAAAMTRFIEDPAFLADCKRNARSLFDREFSYERIAGNLAGSIDAAMARRAGDKRNAAR